MHQSDAGEWIRMCKLCHPKEHGLENTFNSKPTIVFKLIPYIWCHNSLKSYKCTVLKTGKKKKH